ncbi:hypothetical protein [Candidatus Nanohalovita haloferacivicina]|uniref:hypothetical protein n=1 Tax=Candidatus Nanohalovita haloferacivicina TaxID=2978046 RepID=UPI00325FB2D6|nr:hypothetical protein HBNXNv_0826 [Candidatus Nanohalobia archaeon BNXNv]
MSSLDNLSADHFYWLDLAEEYFKDDGLNGRTIPVRAAERFPEIQGEFNDMESMYELEPENVAEPLMAIYGESGEMEGFYLERIEGTTLRDYILENGAGEELIDEVESALETFHENGLVHGDLEGNILYSPEEGIKIIDPVGAGKSHERFDALKKLDKEDVQMYRNFLEKIRNADYL